MRRIILFLVFLSFLTTGAFSQDQNKTATKSEIKDPYAWDFGQVKEGIVLKHSFEFRNESKKTLIIKGVTTSCGCTASKVRKKTLLPGETTLIEVKFNTKGYSGSVQQFVYVHTDDLDNPIIRYIIKAKVNSHTGFAL